jgi:hypothetical protein
LYTLRLSGKASGAALTMFLPRETVALVHAPDFDRTRDQWRQSDIYQIYAEPAVQDFLRKPLLRAAKKNSISQTVQEIEQLDPKDAFVALISIADNAPKVVAGFRFRGSPEDAESIIGKWRSQFLGKAPAATREKIDYQRRKIEVITSGAVTLATVYDGHWFFASNDLVELKAVLDRADHHAKDRQSTLGDNETFRSAMVRMPLNYAVSFYVQPKFLAEKLMALRAAIGQPSPGQPGRLEQIRALCGTSRFDNGKIHDISFAEMPKAGVDAKLARSSLSLGTKDTFFYLATLLNPGEEIDAINPATAGGALVAGWQGTLQALAASGVTGADWKAAFGPELGALIDWPATARWPWFFLTFPVEDMAKAGRILETFTNSEDGTWTQTEKGGVRYFSKRSTASLLSITPTIALSSRILIAGLDPISVETAIKRSDSSSTELANSVAYSNAVRLVPAPTTFFAYVDTALLYSRLDAALRPLLLMSAAFMPAVNDRVDPGKLPPPEAVTKHLSPIVSSRRYQDDGYITESVGPITFEQGAIGLGVLAIAGAKTYQQNMGHLSPFGRSVPPPRRRGTPTPTPSGTP